MAPICQGTAGRLATHPSLRNESGVILFKREGGTLTNCAKAYHNRGKAVISMDHKGIGLLSDLAQLTQALAQNIDGAGIGPRELGNNRVPPRQNAL